MRYINVIIDNKSRHTDTLYTYGVNDADRVTVGSKVKVSFGQGKTPKTAFVMEDNVTPSIDTSKIKKIDSVDSDMSLNLEMVDTALWMKKRYGIKYIDGLKCFIPSGKAPKAGKEKEPYTDLNLTPEPPKNLTREQELAVNTLCSSIEQNSQENYLIHGVTSSGKTEVYMHAIAKALECGKTAIMLVPEIALTKQVIDRFIARFGKGEIAVLHSKLTVRERFDEWQRIRTGQARIVIGARLGVFAPLENIGVIILDEEHEATYKSDMSPKYETVDIALKRLMYYSGVLILGSATPSVVSYQRAKEGIYKLLTLKERYNQTPLPRITLVDMRKEMMEGNLSIFSSRLYGEVKKNLEEGKQIILFLNRRGYSTFISCKKCGEALRCPDCGITLTYHKSENAGVCHYCGRRFKIPDACPECGNEIMKFAGSGTEKVEEVIGEFFSDARIDRLDLDTARNKGEIERIINNFSKGKTDILIGTQLVAKGLDFKNVGLVGVISADVSLNIPDYRSGERTFQLVTQVSGRAGRGDTEGTVIVQSFTPDNFALVSAANHSYQEFFDKEIKIRKMMDYPPFTDLITVSFMAKKEDTALGCAEACKEYLQRTQVAGSNQIFAPRVQSIYKEKDISRYYIFIKCPKGVRNEYIYYLDAFAADMTLKDVDCSMIIDVNPYSIV